MADVNNSANKCDSVKGDVRKKHSTHYLMLYQNVPIYVFSNQINIFEKNLCVILHSYSSTLKRSP